MSEIRVGDVREFYSEVQEEYEPPEKRLRRFTGQTVTVIGRPVDAADETTMFTVRADDGTEFEVHAEEIDGWDFEQGQYFWPDGTWGPDHDTRFLVNERS